MLDDAEGMGELAVFDRGTGLQQIFQRGEQLLGALHAVRRAVEADRLSEEILQRLLGRIAYETWLPFIADRSGLPFGHGNYYGPEHGLNPGVLCSYHPSQQNTSTGRLTQDMLDEIFLRAAAMIRSEPDPAAPRR